MKKIILLLLALCFINLCMAQTKGTGANTTSTTTPKQVKVKYRVIVSFTSYGSGVDGEKYEAIEKFVKTHKRKPAYDQLPAGKEGETDMCFKLKGFSKAEQKKFITDLKALAQGSDRVVIAENAERVKKQ